MSSIFTIHSIDSSLVYLWTLILSIGIIFLTVPANFGPYLGYLFSMIIFGLTIWRYSVHFNVPLILLPVLIVTIALIHYVYKLPTPIVTDTLVLSFAMFIFSGIAMPFVRKCMKRSKKKSTAGAIIFRKKNEANQTTTK